MSVRKPIDRKQAWCKLAVLIADGPHAPREIIFFEPTAQSSDGNSFFDVVVNTASGLWWWADRLGCTRPGDPSVMEHNGRWRQTAETPYDAPGWYGWGVTVKCFDASTLGQPVDELSAVRALADHDVTQGDGEVGASHGDAEAPTAPEGGAA